MIKELGTFTAYNDPRRNGTTYKNERGLDWQRFIFTRVLFNDFGSVIELYEDGSNDNIEGDRHFIAVVDGKVTMVVNRDPSQLLASLPALIIETDEKVEAQMLYVGGVFSAAPPPPLVVRKADVMSALTDEHFEAWDDTWAKTPAKQRVMWDNTTSYTYGTEEYRSVQSMLLALIGPDAYQFFPK